MPESRERPGAVPRPSPGTAARVFGLSDRQIARCIASAAKAAGPGDGVSGHSGHVGWLMPMKG